MNVHIHNHHGAKVERQGHFDEKPKDLNDVLKTLPTAADAPFSAYRRQHELPCLLNTRVDLLREIYNWADGDSSPSIFWLSGFAGTGKSTIAQTVAAEYYKKGQLAGSFFFSRTGGDVNHAGKFITSVAFQLANTIPALRGKICDAISLHNDIASQSLGNQWEKLVLGPLSNLDDVDGRSKYVLVVDALDECEDQDSVQIILQLLAKVQSLKIIQLRVLLTSRPEVPIRYGFDQLRGDEHHDFVLHDIEPSIIDHDISVFLRHQLELIRQKFRFKDGWPEGKSIDRLVQNSGGLFIWAATACRFIGQDSQLAEARLSSILQEDNGMLPLERKLDEIYTTVLTNSVRGEYDEKESFMLHKLFRQAVGPIVMLLDPLSVSSLAKLIGKDLETLRRTLTNFHSVIDVPETESNSVRLLHPSFRDFLLNQERCSNPQFYINEKLVHGEIYKSCLEVMSKHLRRDICNLGNPGACTSDLSRIEVDRYIQPHVQYACRFWVDHYKRSDMGIRGCNDVEVFLRKHFLHWLESLALLGCVSDAVRMVNMLDYVFSNGRTGQFPILPTLRHKIKSAFLSSLNLENKNIPETLEGAARSGLQPLIHDTAHFISTFQPAFEVAALQVYWAGLIFSPKASIIKKTFSNEVPAWFSCTPVSENWNPFSNESPKRSDWVETVAISPDGKTLALALGDQTVKLWNARSGKELQTLKGHSGWVKAVVFSPDGKTLASTSYDKTVKLWDARSGKELQTLEGHSDSVAAVAFSPDRKTLASASGDYTVKLWDARSGKELQTLKGHSGWVSAVAFSPDGKTLASASHDESVKLWDLTTGERFHTLSIGKELYDISFDITGLYLHTEIGTIDISGLSGSITPTAILEPCNSQYRGLAISSDGVWITYNSENLLWLPSEYRPSCSAVFGKAISIGTRLGRIWTCKVELDKYQGIRAFI